MKKRSTGICAEENLCDATAFRMSSARENLIHGIKRKVHQEEYSQKRRFLHIQ